MKKLFSGLSMRIWLPFTISLVLGMSFLAYYYPMQQGRLFRESADKNLDELSKVLTLSIELSLEQQSFEGLSKSIELAKESRDFEFVALVQHDSISGKDFIFASNPVKLDSALVFTPDSTRFIYKQRPLRTKDLHGYVLLASSRDKLEKEVIELNRPVYFILGAVLLLSLFVFLGIARILSRPVTRLTLAANELKGGNYSIAIDQHSGAAEIVELNNALEELRDALLVSKARNEDFSKRLENEIKARTKDLELTRLRLLEAQEVAELGNYEIDLESGDWHASETVYAIFKIPADYPLNDNSWKLLLNPANTMLVENLFRDSVKYSSPFQQDLRITPENNPIFERWVSISGRAIRDESSNTHIIRGTIQDITKRKRIENEVRRLSLVAEKTSNCVIITDTQRKIIWVNESTLRLTEYSRAEIIGQTPAMFQFEKTSEESKAFIRKRLHSLQELKVEVLNRSKSGKEYWLDINIVPLFDEENVHIGFMAVESDITERVKFEQEIKESEENFRSILENSSEMIHTIDNEGKLIWANRSWKEKLGVKNIDVQGLDLVQFLDEKTLEEFQRVIPSLLRGENVTDLNCVFLSTEGTALNLQGRAIPVYKDNAIVGSQAYLHDITSIRKAENDLRQLLELTQHQNERLRNFTHIVSHNLRSHSSNLSGLLKLICLEWPEFKDNVYFSNFQTAVNSLTDVIYNLSEVALIQSEDVKQFSAIDLNSVIEHAIASVYGLAETAGVEIRFSKSDSKLVTGDRAYLDSIVLNLLTNAIKYKAEGRSAFVEISVSKADDFLQLDVRDNGLGIDLERQGRKIFGMYKTFHKHPDARGVGLFLTKNQVEAMGGRIEVKSVVDEGTVFSVFLPTQTQTE
ncbi:MAG: PAS domain S-box protein [Bacteroidia bacterium]|jgi:PAS domain S-box-containing protein